MKIIGFLGSLISLAIFLAGPVCAQKITLKGKVTSKGQIVPFATAEIKTMDGALSQKQVVSDSIGTFSFGNLNIGNYKITISALGYRKLETQVSLRYDQLLNLELEADENQLSQVTVTGRKRTFESDKGKLIFNVQNSALTSGQTALDMLKKLPGVSLGQNEQLLLRGSGGINVMIDGRVSYLSGNQLVNLLKGMSAEDINKIELSITPTAEFDAAGNAGVINIISKKGIKKGYAIDLRTAVSKAKNWMTNQNLSAGLITKKLNLYGSFDFNTPQTFSDNKSGNTVNDNGTPIILERKSDYLFKSNYYTTHLEADWQFYPKHNIAAIYHRYLDDWNGDKNSIVNRYNENRELQSYIHTKNVLIEPYHYDAATLSYGYKMDSLGKKITAEANYTSYRNFSDGLMTTDSYGAQGNYLGQDLLKSYQPGFVKIFSAKMDAVLPFKKIDIKTGLKYAIVSNDNEFRFDTFQSGSYLPIADLSNHFRYKERIAAMYASAHKKINKTGIEIGLRLEHTRADGYTVKQDLANQWEYTRLFPSLTIEQVIDAGNKVDFSISRRINRPSYTDLNPVRWYNDQYFLYSGNPNLVPELAWVCALNYSLGKYIFSVSYNQSRNFIDRRLVIEEDGLAIRSMSDNFSHRKRIDFTASVPFKPLKYWDIQLFGDLAHTAYPISQLTGETALALWSFTATLQQDFSLPNDFKINLAGYFYSSELRGIYQTRPTGRVDFGLKKSLLDKRLDLQLTISDVFNTDRYIAYSKTDVTDYHYNDKQFTRIFALSLKYHLGGEIRKLANRKTEEQQRL